MKRKKRDEQMTQDVALPTDYETGLEDFDPAEAGLPRISINHPDGVFVDKGTNEEFPAMYGVFLGLIKQRVMWAKVVEDDSKPLCKSNDGETGYPNVTGPSHSLFPWSESRIDPASLPVDEHGRPIIKCETCPFTQWGARGANGKSSPPPCSERYTMPVHFSTVKDGVLDHAGIISFQRSGITNMKAFIGSFSRTKMPLFSATFELKLNTNKRGTVTYSTPSIRRVGNVPESSWAEYATEYRSVREALRRPPMAGEESAFGSTQPTPAPSGNSWGPGTAAHAPAAAAAAAPSEPLMGSALVDAASSPVSTAQAAPVVASPAVFDNDDLPF